MPVRMVFRCEFCDAVPDEYTQKALEAQLQELLFGEYVDALPGNWLFWHGNGLYGRNRYCCGDHRGEFKAALRREYGLIGPHPWKMGPHPPKLRRGRVALRERLGPGGGSGPKFGPTL